MVQREYKIYTLSHPITGEMRYVGFTVNRLAVRLAGHVNHAKTRKGNNHKDCWIRSLLSQQLKPKIELLEIVSSNTWEDAERYWISQFKTWGFRLVNTAFGGEYNNLGQSCPKGWEAYRAKPINQYSLDGELIGIWPSARRVEQLLGILSSVTGNACINRTTAGNYQWRFNNDNTPVTEWKGKKRRVIQQFDQQGNYISTWDSSQRAAESLQLERRNIHSCVHGKRKSCGGFIWKEKTE